MDIKLRMATIHPESRDLIAVANCEFELAREISIDPEFKGILAERMNHFFYPNRKEHRTKQILAEVSRGVACYAAYSFLDNNVHLDSLYVKKCFRGFGIGEKLVYDVIERARQIEFDEIFLISPKSALPFYRKMGFVGGQVFENAQELVFPL